MSLLSKFDPEIAQVINNEINRQRNCLEMIASENFVSRVVLEAMGTALTNKYSEGYPGKRYYGGNQFIDESESLAIERAEKLFNTHEGDCPTERIMKANVQPHSGSQANLAAYMALVELGDKIMALDLAHGGHLTHGSPVNFSGKLFNFVHYGVEKKTGQLDMDKIRKQAKIEKPKIILCGYTAYPRKIDFKAFREIADEVGAYLMADIAHIAGLIAAGVHPDCVPYADVITTTTHKTLRGPRGAMILSRVEDRLRPPSNSPLIRGGHKGGIKNLAQKIDFAVFPGMQGGPLDHVIAAKAVAFGEALKPEFKEYAKQVVANAKALAKSLIENGINLVSGGTDNHLVLVDLTKAGVTGKKAETALDETGICVNKNMIPFDPRKPMDPSGLRIGTPALTTRGFKEAEFKEIGKMIADIIHNSTDKNIKNQVQKKVKKMTEAHPLYEGLGV
ncbi:serine hydroxymethyltransferase [Patescibacteria group bacterium]|nr:serine hydroxymethyltransferase [Patescibacteria group bacterium]MBU4512138.1 serine hydroxymethyltransferase [Patescibacteria group bacterium]MCG2692505.1 serine hydroxymethyltransferase [Candidatus Parcubacteria bacterium]